jgi:gamma-glutamylcyclotransferase (GGCT)/AIG2-like uncharacterized protein YtfP
VNLFVYGDLMFPEIMQRVCGGTFKSACGEIHGYARFRIKEEVYPGLTDFPDMATDGVIYFDVDPASAAKLDTFEGDMVERVDVNVQTEDGEWVEAETYVVRKKQRKHLTSLAWEEYDFRRDHLKKVAQALDEAHRKGLRPTRAKC